MKAPVMISALVSMVGAAHAELPPDVYIEKQAKAPEALRIRVIEVESRRSSWSGNGFIWKETVRAEVKSVTRTASGVKAGDRIVIRYTRLAPRRGWAGPSPAPQLKKGAEYPAWLEKSDDGTFKLAAQGASFRLIGE